MNKYFEVQGCVISPQFLLFQGMLMCGVRRGQCAGEEEHTFSQGTTQHLFESDTGHAWERGWTSGAEVAAISTEVFTPPWKFTKRWKWGITGV